MSNYSVSHTLFLLQNNGNYFASADKYIQVHPVLKLKEKMGRGGQALYHRSYSLKLSIADLVRVKAEKGWHPQKRFTKENLIIVT